MENQNKALFSTFLWCRMIGLMPDFLVPDQDWSQYKLPLFPNLKQMSEITSQKLSSFVNEGGLAYISTNGFLPSNLDVKGWDTLQNAKVQFKLSRKIKAAFDPGKLINTDFIELIKSNKSFNSDLEYMDILQYITRLPSEYQLFRDKQRNFPLITYFPSIQGKWGIILNGTAPEINHTSKRNAFKHETMHKLYGWLATLAGVNITFQSSDPCIECGQLIDENRDQQLIIIINHAHNKRKTEIALPNTTHVSSQSWEKKK